jgi:hypothetical protein
MGQVNSYLYNCTKVYELRGKMPKEKYICQCCAKEYDSRFGLSAHLASCAVDRSQGPACAVACNPDCAASVSLLNAVVSSGPQHDTRGGLPRRGGAHCPQPSHVDCPQPSHAHCPQPSYVDFPQPSLALSPLTRIALASLTLILSRTATPLPHR